MSKPRFIAWTVWLVASIFYAYQYVLRVMPSIMINDIMNHFNIDSAIFGQFSGVYYIGYSLMHLPIGIMLDRFGPRKVMTGCILLTVIGLLPIIFADHWIYPVIGRTLIGIGSSAAILGTFKIIRMTFEEAKFTRMLSFSVTIGLIGAIYGGGPVNYMNQDLGYKTVIEIFALMGVALAIVTYFIVPELKITEKSAVFTEIKQVFTNKKVLFTCIFAGLMTGPIEGFADVWGTPFFKQIYNFGDDLSASLPSMIFIGMCFGSPVLSFIAEKSRNYIATIIGAGMVMAIVFIALIVTKLSSNTIAISFVLVGICCAYQILAIYKASTFVAASAAGLTTAVANMIIMIFGYGFHSVIGLVIKSYAENDNAVAYGIAVIPITLVLGSIGFILIGYKKRAVI